MMSMMENRVYTPKEVAHILRVDEETVRREIRRAQLGAIQVGRQYRITVVDLVDWLGKERFIELFSPADMLTRVIGLGELGEEESHALAASLVERARQEALLTKKKAPTPQEVRERRR